jgi:hypothetical protein
MLFFGLGRLMNKEKRAIRKPLPIGIDNFAKVVTGNYWFIDKTLFIAELLNKRVEVSLILRPRRFGKTINLSMLKYFFEQSSISYKYLFESLLINQYQDVMEQQGMYPVIMLSLKDVAFDNWQAALQKIKKKCSDEVSRHDYLLASTKLTIMQKERLQDIINMSAENIFYDDFLLDFSQCLTDHHGKKTIILIDEYDAPIQQGYVYNYYDSVINFMRNFLSAGLKGNDFLEFSVITGVLRIAKESLFSGLNNLDVCSVLDNKYASMFGFTQQEIDPVLEAYGLYPLREQVKQWYNGYHIGVERLYNPWSIINFLSNTGTFEPYWVNTGTTVLIEQILQQADSGIKEEFETLLLGKTITTELAPTSIFRDVAQADAKTLWTLLLFAGYLTVIETKYQQGLFMYAVQIPDQEVSSVYRQLMRRWFEKVVMFKKYQLLLKSLLQGDIEIFEHQFQELVLTSLSSFDVGSDENERAYHMLLLGFLLFTIDQYTVLSNRESGIGRYDIALIPKNRKNAGIIIEVKALKTVTGISEDNVQRLQECAQKALEQIDSKQYDVSMQEATDTLIKIGICCSGKQISIRSSISSHF